MNLLPKTHQEFSQKHYWENFFKKRGTKAFEWYGEYPELCGHLHKYIKPKDDVLVVGCGNSTLSSDLYNIGYNKITNIDISEVVIRQMLNLHQILRPDLKYIQMDVFNMTFTDESFSVVLDKGTLDALMPDDKPETLDKILTYFKEINRILKIGGRYVCISLLQKHILDFVLDYFPSNNWMFRVVRCLEAEKKNENENSLPVFMIVCTKFRCLPQKILEISMCGSEKMDRLENLEDVSTVIFDIQQAAFICSGLRRTNMADENDVSFDLYRPKDVAPRYTIHVVDVPHDHKYSTYAAFVVPQGREVEWMFSTSKGRKHLAKMVKYNRLAIITMHRGQVYDSLESIQSELQEAVCEIAPEGLTGKILFLSLGTDVGQRMIRCEGNSTLSGKYIVEDVEINPKEKFRRLFYMSSQFVVQSEAKLKTIKTKKGVLKEVVDHLYLTCKHHVYMSIATKIGIPNTPSSVAVVGLGGGGLCMFLRKFLPQVNITAIDIDSDMLEVAKTWFDLKVDNKLHVTINDGIEFLHTAAENGTKFNVILFDVDSKDTSIGMSCPPQGFLQPTVLQNVIKCLVEKGFLVINVVMRDESLRAPLLTDVVSKFSTVASYKLEEDLNEIIICSPYKYDKNNLRSKVKEANNSFDEFLRKNKVQQRDVDEINHFIDNFHFSVT
ncbi:hypothetical protein RN001_008105 [Aquatica leii]|uniref:Methyltransferase type 11 domain-containing protein n=1 Tax=Aquatica leii TaxID=1421715 RepID=A0AAN7SH50_9COLE|nr:hypothetical protein RN001_008105 [Aquatica leii]